MFSDQELSDIALKLKADNSAKDTAVAEDSATPGTIHYAVRAARAGKEPYSAAVKLMQIGKQQKLKLRKPMVSTAALTEMDKGMSGVTDSRVIVASTARNIPVILPPTAAPTTPHTKVTVLKLADIEGWEERDNDLASFKVPDLVSPGVNITSETRTTDHTGMHTAHRIYMMAAYALMTSRISGAGTQWATGKNIGVLLVDATGKIIACGVNTNAQNGTFHAEVNCLQSYYKFNKNGFGGFPADARLYSTLEPCEMCAGMIWETARDPAKFLAYYGMVDPNQLAQKTKLSKEKRERLLSQWQEISHRTDRKSQVERGILGSMNEKDRQGPKAIKLYEETTGPNAYQLVYADYSAYLEGKKASSTLSAADFMTNPLNLNTNPDPARATIPKVNQSLMRKVTKYTTVDADNLNPNVKKVVLHVRDFLKQMGVVGF
jgi:tRNA(Arg) A34 adenosine deaminase TadA